MAASSSSSYPSTGGGYLGKRVLVIYTGGTMGMLPKADGSLDVSPGFFTDLMLKMEEMRHPGLPHIDILEYERLMDSACLGPRDWGQFAADVERHYYDYDGFVCVHGTDTMAYTASALVRELMDGWMGG
jgi:L-asparaginase